MRNEISDSLRTVARLGAKAFGSTGLAGDIAPTIRRVRRRRAGRAGGIAISALLAVGAVSYTAIGIVNDATTPAITPSPSATGWLTPTPSPSGMNLDPLPGCDGSTEWSGTNGDMDPDSLCTLWDGVSRVRSDSAVDLARLNEDFRAEFGSDICIISSYRSIGDQSRLRDSNGDLATEPGHSYHGWGVAIDVCPGLDTGERWIWLNQHGPEYGWEQGSRPPAEDQLQPWHFEYAKGTTAMGWDPEASPTAGGASTD